MRHSIIIFVISLITINKGFKRPTCQLRDVASFGYVSIRQDAMRRKLFMLVVGIVIVFGSTSREVGMDPET